jgi:hypothetical protein
VIGNAVHVMRIATGEIEDTGTEKNGATSIFFMPIIASNARFASSPAAASASVSTRGVICQEMPHLSLHQQHSLSCPPLPLDRWSSNNSRSNV